MSRHSLTVQLSSARTGKGRDDWQTPECVLERVRRLGPIVLDPCGAEGNPCCAGQCVSYGGLHVMWDYFGGLVYVNPPYSSMREWIQKCAMEASEGVEIVALVAARPDTRWFGVVWDTAQAVCFWRGRLRFRGAAGAAPFPSAVVYWGSRVDAFALAFGDAGKVLEL